MNKDVDNRVKLVENTAMNRKIRRYHAAVVEKIVRRSPHLSPEEVAQVAQHIILTGH